jgi:predicted PurR-regulated permease PerM
MTSNRSEEAVEPPAAPLLRRRTLEYLNSLHSFVVALLLSVALLWLLSDVILILFAAILLACQLQGAATFIAHRTRLPHAIALAVVILVVCGGFALAFWLRGPVIVGEARGIADQVHQQVVAIWSTVGDADWLKSVQDRVETYLRSLEGHATGMAAGFVTSTLGTFGTALLVIVAAIYLAASPDQYARGLVALMPRPWHGRAYDVLKKEGETLRWWFIGQLGDMAAIGVLTGLGLMLLGVKLYVALGVIAALCNFVPYIGALAGSVPAIVVGLSDGPRTALSVAILFVVVQTFEGNVLAPLIQKRTVDLPPVVTLMSQTVLGTLFGPMGLILATPITAAAMLLVRMVYVETILGNGGDDAIEDQ